MTNFAVDMLYNTPCIEIGEFDMGNRVVAMIIFAGVISRSCILGGSFIPAISFIAYRVWKNPREIYLLLPAAAGVISWLPKGGDVWGGLAVMCFCGIFFAAVGKGKLRLRQAALVTAGMTLVCTGVYRLVTGTVYMTSVEMLMVEGLAAGATVYVFDAFFSPAGKRPFIVICILLLNGVGGDVLIWPTIIFITLSFLVYADVGTALFMATTGAVTAALTGQEQWGVMATIIVAIAGASLVKSNGGVIVTAVFAVICWMLGFVGNGVVLGVSEYETLFSSGAFLLLYRVPADPLGKLMPFIYGKGQVAGMREDLGERELLRERREEMKELAELYDSYFDSRSALAGQFKITEQILQDILTGMGREHRKSSREYADKFQVNVAISQCAAAGAINGDCCGWRDIGDGKTAMVISDGMGKGKKAATESLMVTRTILSLLKSGATVDMTLKMINTIMLMKEDEDFYATVDLTIIDRKTGTARFYKIGGAPTLVRRKNNVKEVNLSAIPLGIVNGLKIKYVEMPLKKDDWIIMMSDGVSDGGQGGNMTGTGSFINRLGEVAADIRSEDPRTMSDLLLNHAADSYIGRERDDMTVMVAKVL